MLTEFPGTAHRRGLSAVGSPQPSEERLHAVSESARAKAVASSFLKHLSSSRFPNCFSQGSIQPSQEGSHFCD